MSSEGIINDRAASAPATNEPAASTTATSAPATNEPAANATVPTAPAINEPAANATAAPALAANEPAASTTAATAPAGSRPAGALRDIFQEVLEKLLRAYSGYYNIKRESSVPAFCAEAEFHLHDEQYFLIKAAKLSESETKETIFFAKTDVLDAEKAMEYAAKAWEEGLSRITPGPNHRCSDVSLIILAGSVTPDAREAIRKNKEVKSYRFGLYGYSHFRMVAYDLSKKAVVRNKMGDTLEKVICDMFL